MTKILSLILISTVICVSLAHRNSRGQPWYYGIIRPFISTTSICTNSTNTTIQATYLAKTIALINNFQLDSTYNPVLQTESTKFVSYIKNSTNQALLYSNCPAFVAGVKAAKLADTTAAILRKRTAQDICRQFQQVPRDATGSNGPNDLDGSGCQGFDSDEH